MQKRGNENKPHVGIFGRCNVGKSTLFNMLVGEDNALVSNVAGTTTDPVRRAFEIPFFAPVLLIDTPGLGDISVLGSKRIDKSLQILDVVDMAILLFEEWEEEEERFLEEANKRGVSTLLIYNLRGKSIDKNPKNSISLDISDIVSRGAVCDKIKEILPKYSYEIGSILGDKISENDLVLLVAPIDSEAPAGRLILPQVQTIRDILDNKAITMVVQTEQLKKAFALGIKPKLVVTDSQVYDIVLAQTPKDIAVETFSALLAEFKGDMAQYKKGLPVIDKLRDNDIVLILESCLHHTTCDDIGRNKLPMWLEKYTGKKLNFEFISGLSPLPSDMSKYAMALQCGACMITRRQLMRRLHALDIAKVPVTNYGMCIKKILVK